MKKTGAAGQVQSAPVVPGMVVGRDGRMDVQKGQLRIQEVARAFELLHSSEPDSEDKLLALMNAE